MCIRRIKCNECLTVTYNFNEKTGVFLPIIYGIPHYKALLDYFTIKY